MATYGIVYRMQFEDSMDLLWQIDFREKDALDAITPIIIQHGGANPITINWGGSDDDSSPIISSVATISYYVVDNAPTPETFINIEEDTWIIDVNRIPDKNTPVLYWRGFIKPDNNRYPYLPSPYLFSFTAVDFTFSKGVKMNLNDTNLFLYDFITLGDFVNRTLFYSAGYTDIVCNFLFNIKPDSIGDGTLIKDLFTHTAAFYDFTNGAMFCYDALTQLLQSLYCRMIYSNGAYWIQRIPDVTSGEKNIISITPLNTDGDDTVTTDTTSFLSSSLSDNVSYLNSTQYLVVNAALKQQQFNYSITGITQLVNFDWRDYNGTYYPGWSIPTPLLVMGRAGTGSIEDQYRNVMSGSGDTSINAFISQTVHVRTGQHITLDMKAFVYWTTGVLVDITLISLSGGHQYALTAAGQWVVDDDASAFLTPNVVSSSSKDRLGTLSIVSDAIPFSGDGTYDLIFNIRGPIAAPADPQDPVPPGATRRNEVYPVFLSVFNTAYIEYDETILNRRNYSLVADTQDLFFLDIQDDHVANSLFYDNAGVKSALPLNDWNGMSVDELNARSVLDQQNKPGYSFDGDVRSNTLMFHHCLLLRDFNNKPMRINRDSYNIKTCTHSILATEIMEQGSGDGVYSVIPKTTKDS